MMKNQNVMKNHNARHLAIVGCAFGLLTTGLPAAEVSVTVEASATKTLEQALTAEGKTLGNADTLVKLGDGRLTLGAMPEFTGEIQVRRGFLNATVSTSLGATNTASAGVTKVFDGATLEVGTATTAQKTLSFRNKTIVIEGMGVNGQGAIRSLCWTDQKDDPIYPLGSTLQLSGDAFVSVPSDYVRHDFGSNLDLGGHTLTLSGSFSLQFVKCQNPGHIVCSFGKVLFPAQASSTSDASNTFTFKSGAQATFSWSSLKNWIWTLVMDGGKVRMESGGSDDYWNGPVWLKGPVQTVFEAGDSRAKFRIPKEIYGDGGINWTKTFGELRLQAVNSFKGGITFGGGTLQLEKDGAVPSGEGCGKMVLTNTRLLFSGVANITLPETEFVGTGHVGRCSGRWTGPLVKRGAGELFYDSLIGGDLLDVREGTVRFNRKSIVGLNHGTKTFGSTDDAKEAYALGVCYTNSTSLRLDDFEKSGWANYFVTTYDGYIWNRTGADVTWTWHGCVDDGCTVSLDGQTLLSQGSWDTARTTNVVLTAGCHAFQVRGWNGTGGSGASDANGKWKNADGSKCKTKGVAVDRQARGNATNAGYYEPLVDPGDGSLFTTRAEFAPFVTIRCAPGARVDFDGLPYPLANLEGFPTFVNAALTVKEKWTVEGVDVAAGQTATLDGKLTFAAGARLVVSDAAGSWRLSGDLRDGAAICTAEGGIEGMPDLVCSKDGAYLKKSADGKSLILHATTGLVIFLK